MKRTIKNMIEAIFSSPKISKFLMISYLSNRYKQQESSIPNKQWTTIARTAECKAPISKRDKIEAEEFLDAMAVWRRSQRYLPDQFQSIHVASGNLSELPETGKVEVRSDTIASQGEAVSRHDVATTLNVLLTRSDTHGRYSIMAGQDDIEFAVEKAVAQQKSRT